MLSKDRRKVCSLAQVVPEFLPAMPPSRSCLLLVYHVAGCPGFPVPNDVPMKELLHCLVGHRLIVGSDC